MCQVSDYAGNVATARSLVLYDNSSFINTTDSPFHVSNANPHTNYQWLTSNTKSLEVSWVGHFENPFYKNEGVLNVVKPWHTTENFLEDTTDNRTTAAIPNRNGLVMYEIAYEMSNDFGEDIDEPRTWTTDADLSETHTFSVNMDDGDSVVMWVRATDAMGRNKTSRTVVHMDTTAPVVTKKEFLKDVNSGLPTLPFASAWVTLWQVIHSPLYNFTATLTFRYYTCF